MNYSICYIDRKEIGDAKVVDVELYVRVCKRRNVWVKETYEGIFENLKKRKKVSVYIVILNRKRSTNTMGDIIESAIQM